MSKSRIEAFTDAVIAIIMTLLVLELHEPSSADWSAFLVMKHKFIVYLISFVSLAIYWNNHHHLFHLVKKVDGWVLWANNFLILMMTLFPYATAWVGNYPFDWPPQALYGSIILGTEFAYYLLVRALVRANGIDSQIGQMFRHYPKLYLSIGLTIVALILGKLIAPIAVLIVNALILLMWFIPEKSIEKTL
ncbi:TMEM175 family protein [Enterococcus dongliensis]|uniref:TMEM175 family protein n=1 Tax=Enterococcus dongliensis TaxID=2559925 RepID=UPI00288ECDBF|nr:TMEM175 family protein [Enterococcus dongliensis]MDT2640208.1 TMEM175 family protein [Enterococcus dongliensis]